MKRLQASKKFKKQLKKLPPQTQQKIILKLQEFLSFLIKGQIPQGFGFKKINCDKYEIRVTIKLRIVMKEEKGVFVCHLIGNHDEVMTYLKRYRNK